MLPAHADAPVNSLKATTVKPEAPEVGQTRQILRTAETLEIIDEGNPAGASQFAYLCRYNSGVEQWHSPGELATWSNYVSGPVERKPSLVHEYRVKRALDRSLNEIGVNREAAKVVLLGMQDTTGRRENEPTVEDMVKAVGLMAAFVKPQVETIVRYLSVLAHDDGARPLAIFLKCEIEKAFLGHSLTVERVNPQADTDQPRMFDLNPNARAPLKTISAVVAFVEGHGGKVVWGSTKDAAPKPAHPLHCDPSFFEHYTHRTAEEYNTRIDRAVVTLEYLLRQEGWAGVTWTLTDSSRPDVRGGSLVSVVEVRVACTGSGVASPRALKAEYENSLDRLDSILMLVEQMIWNACKRITEKHTKVVAGYTAKSGGLDEGRAAADEIAKAVSGTTAPDLSDLDQAIAYLNSHGWTALPPEHGSSRRPSYVYSSVEEAKANLAPRRLLIGTRQGALVDLPKSAISFPRDGVRIEVDQAWVRDALGIDVTLASDASRVAPDDEPCVLLTGQPNAADNGIRIMKHDGTRHRPTYSAIAPEPAPVHVVSATLDSTTFDRDGLALNFIKMRVATWAGEAKYLAVDAYRYADEMIRQSATVPDDVKTILASAAARP